MDCAKYGLRRKSYFAVQHRLPCILLVCELIFASAPHTVLAESPALGIDVRLKDYDVRLKNYNFELLDSKPGLVGTLTVIAKVQNVTQHDVTLYIFSCGYINDWMTDSKVIKVHRMSRCLSNVLNEYNLKPGKFYELPIPLDIVDDIPLSNIHFHLGYEPDIIGIKKKSRKQTPFWSSGVILLHKWTSSEEQKNWHEKSNWLSSWVIDNDHTDQQ